MPEERREYVADEIRRIQPLVGQLEVNETQILEVYVDGALRGRTPLKGPMRVAVGNHSVTLKRGKEVLLHKSVQIAGGMVTSVSRPEPTHRAQEPEPDKSVQDSPTSDDVEEPSSAPVKEQVPPKTSPLLSTGFALIGTGAAAAIGGAITGAIALSNSNQLESACGDNKERCDSSNEHYKTTADSMATVTNVLLPIGGVLAATGVVLVVLAKKKSKSESLSVTASPVTAPNFKGIVLEGRF